MTEDGSQQLSAALNRSIFDYMETEKKKNKLQKTIDSKHRLEKILSRRKKYGLAQNEKSVWSESYGVLRGILCVAVMTLIVLGVYLVRYEKNINNGHLSGRPKRLPLNLYNKGRSRMNPNARDSFRDPRMSMLKGLGGRGGRPRKDWPMQKRGWSSEPFRSLNARSPSSQQLNRNFGLWNGGGYKWSEPSHDAVENYLRGLRYNNEPLNNNALVPQNMPYPRATWQRSFPLQSAQSLPVGAIDKLKAEANEKVAEDHVESLNQEKLVEHQNFLNQEQVMEHPVVNNQRELVDNTKLVHPVVEHPTSFSQALIEDDTILPDRDSTAINQVQVVEHPASVNMRQVVEDMHHESVVDHPILINQEKQFEDSNLLNQIVQKPPFILNKEEVDTQGEYQNRQPEEAVHPPF